MGPPPFGWGLGKSLKRIFFKIPRGGGGNLGGGAKKFLGGARFLKLPSLKLFIFENWGGFWGG